MALLVTSSVQIARFANALYGVKLGSVTNAAVLEDVKALGVTSAFNSYYTASFGSSTNDAVATTILANLGLAGNSAAQAYVVGQLNAAGSAKGAAVLSMLNAFANMTSDATFGAAATAWNTKVTDAIAYTAANAADVTTDYSAPVTSQTFTLTTSVDAFSGGAGNDTFAATMATASTYNVGDNINGGAGTDTLNIIDVSGTAASVVSLDGVEIVNVRSLVATGTDVTELDASDWDGVTKLTNASSIAGSELQVSGLSISTNVNLIGNTDISIEFSNTTTANAAATLVGAGTFAGVTTYGVTGVTSNATAHLNLDAGGAGRVSAIAVELSGNNLANIEAGANVEVYTITGNGSAVLFTDDTLISVDASGYAGSLDITLNGASDVVAKGGAGNDTFRFGETYTNADSFDGGAGTDSIAATIGAFNRNLNTTNVEAATLTFSEAAGGDVNASASTITSYTFAAGTAGNAASVSQVADGSTITLNDDDLGDVTLDYASGALTSVLNIGSVSGTVAVGTLAITDVAKVTINSVGATAGATIGTATFDADVKEIVINTSGSEADLTIGTTNTDGSLGGATSLTVTSNGSAAITFNNIDIGGSAALKTVTLSANNSNAADITLGDVSGSALTTVTLTALSGADITVGTLDLGNDASGGTQDETISITQGSNSNVTVGAISVSGQGTININVTQQATGIADIAQITLIKSTEATADEVGKNITFGAITVAASGEVAINGIDMAAAGTGAQVTFGEVVVSQDGGYSAGAISGSGVNIDVSSFTITVGASATATFGAIEGLSAGAVGARSITLLSDATATFGTVTASAISTHSIVANTGASANFGAMTSEGAVGAFAIGGVDGADVQFGAIGASGAIGAITVSGELDVTFGTITAARIGEVDNTQQGSAGTFTIDLSGVVAAAEVKLGAATNTVISGVGNDLITLLAGRTSVAGNDNIQYGTASQGNDTIINFIGGAAASGGDQIEFDISAFGTGIKDADGSAIAAAEGVVFGTASGAAVTLGASANVILFTTAYASTAALITDAAADITLSTGTLRSGDFFAVWTDGTNAYVSQIHIEEGASATDGIIALASASGITVTTFASISNVSAGALVAANFEFV